AVDGDDVMSAGLREADLQDVLLAAPRMEDGTAAAVPVGVDEAADLGLDAGLRKRRDHELPFPGVVVRRLPVLQRAAAAGAEMRADRHDPRRARLIDTQQAAAIRMARHGLDLDGLARQRVWYVNRPVGAFRAAVAAVADLADDQPLNHAAPR